MIMENTFRYKIAVLYICTGKYSVFWDEFYKSSEEKLLTNHHKTYFVFTDSEGIRNSENVKVNYQKKLGWPYDTLKRFEIFTSVIDELDEFDFIFFFNANAKVYSKIDEEILPINEGLVGVQHPCHWNSTNHNFIYERNPQSLAYIEPGKGENYFMGSFNGGKAADFSKLIKTLSKRIIIDEENGIIAIWHDESHLNRYFLDNEVKVLPPSYAYPEEMELPFEKRILLRDKKKWGGHNLLRGIKETNQNRFLLKVKNRLKRILK